MPRLRVIHLLFAVLLFCIEVVIAFTLDRGILRTWGGDLLVVMFLYFFFRALLQAQPWPVAIGVLIFAFAIEVSQYFHLIDRLGLSDVLLARLILGNTFEWTDFVAYTLGVVIALVIDLLILLRSFDPKK